MITPNAPSLPPTPAPQDFQAVMALVALISNPSAIKERIDRLTAAAEEARKGVEGFKSAAADLASQKAAHEIEIAASREKHAAALQSAQSDFDQRCAERGRSLQAREDALGQKEAALHAETASIETLKSDLERRLSHLRAAAE